MRAYSRIILAMRYSGAVMALGCIALIVSSTVILYMGINPQARNSLIAGLICGCLGLLPSFMAVFPKQVIYVIDADNAEKPLPNTARFEFAFWVTSKQDDKCIMVRTFVGAWAFAFLMVIIGSILGLIL